ncbi:prephenate dehydrogenase/arogenate dehydrogenase family protein, partial [Pseudomonas umsongensis]
MSVPLFEKVAFIGLGLIGSSLARVMIAEGLTQNIVASTRSEKTLQDAQALGLIQQGYSDPVQAVQGADLVVLALPVRATQKVLETIKPYLQEHTIITDVGSTKGNV